MVDALISPPALYVLYVVSSVKNNTAASAATAIDLVMTPTMYRREVRV